MKNAVILAAGRGTRMGALTARSPKPLLTVAGRSLIEHILLGVAAAGIERAVIVTGYLAEQIERALGDGSRLGVRIEYRRQERAEGTARALLLAESALGAGPFLLGWGDILVEPQLYAEMVRDFESAPCDALLAVNEVDDPWRGAAVYAAPDGRVTRLVEKPPRGSATTRWNNAGLHVFAPVVLEYARRLEPSPRGEYELPQAVGRMVEDGCIVRAHPVRGFWSDVGTPDDLQSARRSFAAVAMRKATADAR
jgi:NDP-sugar pyrophosphorylase family protein